MEEEKNKNEERKALENKLLNTKNSLWLNEDGSLKSEEERNLVFKFADGYINMLNKAKIEREFVEEARKKAEGYGFTDLNLKSDLKPGDKIYYINNKKAIYLAVIGYEDIENGINMIGGHIDSPRLDLKPNPIYEDGNLRIF